jgi:DNA-binding transcriptional MerR regulator
LAERAYLSIGDVLGLLREEFPDITISKIRFLESQGLLDPERTPSGYRKFYDGDVERLRWILHQQKENFLPLKVIKGRLEDGRARNGRQRAQAGGSRPEARRRGAASAAPAGAGEPAGGEALAGATRSRDLEEVRTGGPSGSTAASSGSTAGGSGVPAQREHVGAVAVGTAGDAAAGTAATASAGGGVGEPRARGGTGYTLEELSSASGLGADEILQLEAYGLVATESVAGTTYYDEESMPVAKLAAGFKRFGVEARHLRSYKNAVEREAGLFEQIIIPLLKQRNPESRRRAVESLAELARLGAGMRASLLRRSLGVYSGG